MHKQKRLNDRLKLIVTRLYTFFSNFGNNSTKWAYYSTKRVYYPISSFTCPEQYSLRGDKLIRSKAPCKKNIKRTLPVNG